VSVLRGVIPCAQEEPLTLELDGAAALYAQRVDGLWLLSYTHPFSAHQAFCAALVLQAVARVADTCREAAAAQAAAQQQQQQQRQAPAQAAAAPRGASPVWHRQHAHEQTMVHG